MRSTTSTTMDGGNVGTGRTAFASSFAEARLAVKKLENETTTSFASYKTNNIFGNNDVFARTNYKISWQDKSSTKKCRMENEGFPFVVLATKLYDCHHGKDRHSKRKRKEKTEQEHAYVRGRGTTFLTQDSKKLDCPAQCVLREIVRFPSYKVTDPNNKMQREKAAGRLRRDLKDKSALYEKQIAYELPQRQEHIGHPLDEAAGISQPLDPRLAHRISELVLDGVRSVGEMKRDIKRFVRELCTDDMPSLNNRRFYPRDRIIRNHMYTTELKNRVSSMDQDNVEHFTEQWQKDHPEDFVYLRKRQAAVTTMYRDPSEDDEFKFQSNANPKLLFIYQSEMQRRLLEKYGSYLTLLDATYKTTKYALPLFFLAVKTNVDYQVVAAFVVEDEKQASIKEAIQLIKAQNPSWHPENFMTDFDEEEISSLEEVFPGSMVYLCDFHREQAWERWCSKHANGVADVKDDVLKHLRSMAHAEDVDHFEAALQAFQTSIVWDQHPKLRSYVSNVWLPQKKRWAWAYRKTALKVNVNTNNGIERQHKTLKYSYLMRVSGMALSAMLRILMEDFFPDRYQSHVQVS